MSKTSDLGDRMKYYEAFESYRELCIGLPVIARMDGICFSSFTHGLVRPFDKDFSKLMVATAEALMHGFGANAAYTQSDEITLGWAPPTADDFAEFFCGGRIQKLTSRLSAFTSVYFNRRLPEFLPDKVQEQPIFDARVFSVPNTLEAANQFLWREQDCTKNSISMAARHYFSHADVQNKNGSELQEMLFQKYNINWNDYPSAFKRGTFLVRRRVSTAFTPEELATLPPKHRAHADPSLVIERNKVIIVEHLPPFSKVTNRVGFLFNGEEPDILSS